MEPRNSSKKCVWTSSGWFNPIDGVGKGVSGSWGRWQSCDEELVGAKNITGGELGTNCDYCTGT